MGDERENMVSFVRGLLDTMPLSSLTQRKVREKYREKYNKTPLNTEQSQLLRNVVLEVASSELSKEAQQKKPSTPTNQNPPKNDKDQDPTVSSTVSTDQPAGQKRPLESKKETPDSKKQKVQEIESDDDCVVVECRQADILPHCRADCPVEPYSFTENVKIGAFENNAKHCDKCFCYICDVKASECKFWNTPREPHCNANSKAPCWKARRMVNNQVKFAFIQRALHKHIQPHRQDAIKSEAKIVCVEMREVYQAYRAGTKCDAKLVPCNCVCHRQKTPQHWCAKCRSVHDLKKKFDYRPVRAKMKELVGTIQRFTQQHAERVFLYEIIVAELALHKGADINQMTQQSGNPDVTAQCNHHDMLKVDYLLMGLAQSLAPNAALWKEFNEALRLLFRSQAFPDQFIKQYFEQLQSNINRERRAGAVHRNQPVQNHNRQNIPYGGGNNQFGNFQHHQIRQIQPNFNMNPGGPGHGQPFRGGTTAGTGTTGVRAISPATFSPNAGARLAISSTIPSTARTHAARIQSPATMGTSRPISPAISVQVQSQLPNIKLLSAAEEEELIKKCEENIKQGQFNVTNKNIKPTIQSYRQRNIKFHKDQMIVCYLSCLAHVNPHETLRELWNFYRFDSRARFNYYLTPEDLARIIGTVIQDVPKRKQVVIVRPFQIPPDWPLAGPTAPFKKEDSLLREVFLVLMAFLKQASTGQLYGNVELLVFALRIFCPTWSHTDGNDLREMIKYYQATKEILRELEPEKTMGVNFDQIVKNHKMRDKVGNGTTRVFCIVFLLAKHWAKWEPSHPTTIMNLMAHPRTKQSDITDRQVPAENIWNFVLFALCNQHPAATKMIDLGKYPLLEWYLKFLSNTDNGMRYNTVSNYLNIEVVKILCQKGTVLFAIRMFESLFGTISDFLINGKLNQDSKKKYYDKYIEIGCSLADRIKEQLINENFVRTGESGGKVLHMVPDWFGKIDFISSLTFGAAEIQRNKLETLHLFSLFKKTTIQRKYVNQHSPVDISLQLFGDNKQYPNANIQIKLQSRILTSFLNGILDHKNSESELFLQEVMTKGTPYPRDDMTFLKCMRLLISMSKRRHGKGNLTHVVIPSKFRANEFQHHCNANYDPSFNMALIIRTICDGDDDAMEYIHMENYHLLIEIIAEATFSWLACGSCVKESTKMIEERVKTGSKAALTMINKLHRRKRNTTGFLKTFFTHFWNFVLEQSVKHPKFKVFEEHSNEFNHLANSLDLIGKIFISLSSHSEYFTHIVTKIRSSPNLDTVFKANSLKFMGVPPVRDMAKTIHDEKPKFHSKPFSDIFLNGTSNNHNTSLPPMPRLQRKPYSPKMDSDGRANPDGLGIDNKEVNRIHRKNGCKSDDDFVPDLQFEMNGVNEPSKKRTRFETDKQRQERLAQEKTRRKEHQEEIRAIKKRLMGAKMKVLKRDGFMLPVGYDLDEMLINTFDVESWRSEFKNPIPKLKISL